MLDTCALAETARREHGEPAFSAAAVSVLLPPRAGWPGMDRSAIRDAPNLRRATTGHGCSCWMVRPTVTSAQRRALGRACFSTPHPMRPTSARPARPGPGRVGRPARGRMPPSCWPMAATRGWYETAPGHCCACPAPRFRPSHADALHLDLWIDGAKPPAAGRRLVPYNAEDHWLRCFGRHGSSHNTVAVRRARPDATPVALPVRRLAGGRGLTLDEASTTVAPPTATARAPAPSAPRSGSNRGDAWSSTRWLGLRDKAVLRWRIARTGGWCCADEGLSDARLRIAVRRRRRSPVRMRRGLGIAPITTRRLLRPCWRWRSAPTQP